MKEIPKHRIGEIVYHRVSNLYLVIAYVTYNTVCGYTYYLEYVPGQERLYNPLCSHYAGGYSEVVFGDIFEICLNL